MNVFDTGCQRNTLDPRASLKHGHGIILQNHEEIVCALRGREAQDLHTAPGA